jgi:glycosyltransferase involved in cell wall biosynthesis
MKVLMFGWEFPPHISGGLGTASYGLTRGLSTFNDLDILFVVPKAYGDEDQSAVRVVGANDVDMRTRKYHFNKYWKQSLEYNSPLVSEVNYVYTQEHFEPSQTFKEITYIEVNSGILPYLDAPEFEKLMRSKNIDPNKVTFDHEGKMYVEDENGERKEITVSYSEISTTNEEGKFEFTGKYGTNLYQEVSNYAEVARQIALNNDFDIIHAHDWLTYAAGVAAKEISGKPLVIHVHATEFDRSGESVNQKVYDIERMGMHAADMIIAVSNLTRDIVINRYGVSPDKVVTVYNAVEPGVEQEAKEFKKTINKKIVTFLGRITFQKGPEYFVEAARKVLDRTDDVRFVMAGSGDLLHKMIKRVAELKMGSKFYFPGFMKGAEVDKIFNISDVYVMPSVSEPFGISPLEAMRSNVPVIISHQSGVAEILKHAVKTDFWDTDAIADSIYSFIKYEGLSKMFKENSKAEVDELKWENSAAHVRKAYYDTYYRFLNS